MELSSESELDERGPSTFDLPIQKGDFVISKVFGKASSYRLYVAKITEVNNGGFEGFFYKRIPQTFKFIETTEQSFLQKDDIVKKLSQAVQSSSIRFKDAVGFQDDLSSYSALLA